MIRISVLDAFHVSVIGGREPATGPVPLHAVASPPHATQAIVLSEGSQRLVAALAIRDRPADRGALAAQLWPDARDGRAGSSLRSAIARLGEEGRALVAITPTGIALRDDVRVDIRIARATAARLLDPRLTDAHDHDLMPDAVALFGAHLLPDWFDTWLEPAAEEWRHLRVNALEAQSEALRQRGRLPEAAYAARRAIDVDPLRETAQRCLIAVHLAAGNQSDALQAYRVYCDRLGREIGLAPTRLLSDLVSGMHERAAAVRGAR